jgi:hypothetical protein
VRAHALKDDGNLKTRTEMAEDGSLIKCEQFRDIPIEGLTEPVVLKKVGWDVYVEATDGGEGLFTFTYKLLPRSDAEVDLSRIYVLDPKLEAQAVRVIKNAYGVGRQNGPSGS